MSKVIKHEELSDTLAITECNDGWWLYDKTRGFNLAMRAKSKDAAFLEALEYYQYKLMAVEESYKELSHKVNCFVHQLGFDEEDVCLE